MQTFKLSYVSRQLTFPGGRLPLRIFGTDYVGQFVMLEVGLLHDCMLRRMRLFPVNHSSYTVNPRIEAEVSVYILGGPLPVTESLSFGHGVVVVRRDW